MFHKLSSKDKMCSGEHGLLTAVKVWSRSHQSVFSRHSSVGNKSEVLMIYTQTGWQSLLVFLLSV